VTRRPAAEAAAADVAEAAEAAEVHVEEVVVA
jgi:hypothetical protein